MSRTRIPVASVRMVVMAIILAGAVSQAGDAASSYHMSSSHIGTVADMSMLDAALEVHLEFSPLPSGIGKIWEKMDSIAALLDATIMLNAPTVDRWENPLLVRFIGETPILLSCGPNGVLDDEDQLNEDLSTRYSSLSRLNALPGDDLVFCDGSLIRGPMSIEDHWNRDMADLRTLATAAAAYTIDHDLLIHDKQYVANVASLSSLLVPSYIRLVPEENSWGHPFGVIAYQDQLAFISYGSDGVPDMNYEMLDFNDVAAWNPGFTDPASDIVHLGYEFVSYPAGDEGDQEGDGP